MDDIIVMGEVYYSIYMLKKILASRFEVNDLGPVKSFFIVEFFWHENELCMRQSHFI